MASECISKAMRYNNISLCEHVVVMALCGCHSRTMSVRSVRLGVRLVARRHIDLMRVASAAVCAA